MQLTAIMPGGRDADERATTYVGMTIALASWLMLFASLFLAYAVLRVQQPVWPPVGTAPPPRLQGWLNTLVLAASSAALWWGTRRERGGDRAGLRRWTWIACALGALFLVLQLVLWRRALQIGIVPAGVFGSVFYALTMMHALHVLGGLVALAWLAMRAGPRRPRARALPLQPVTMYWHFVDLVWVAMFVAVFLI